MAVVLKPGTRLFSAVDDGQFITVRAPAYSVDLTVGGVEMVLSSEARPPDAEVANLNVDAEGADLGKHYVDGTENIDLLCTRAGRRPAVNGQVLAMKQSKPLPASD
jgi:hypothetical protein